MSELKLLKTTVSIGLEKPLKFLHVSDTHFTRDSKKTNNRAAVFETTDEQIEANWRLTVEYAKANGLPIIHTGDLVDYVTEDNLAILDKELSDLDFMLAPGSHDFGHLIPGAPEYFEWKAGGGSENDAYKADQIKIIAPHVKNNMYFDARVIGGVNFVTIDNSYLKITDGQLEALKAEVAKGYPVVIAMHIPFHTKGLMEQGLMPRESLCCTEAEQREFAEKHNRPDTIKDIRIYTDSTWRMMEYVKSEPLVKVVLAGHRHRNHEEELCDGTTQIVTHAGCHGYAREITLI